MPLFYRAFVRPLLFSLDPEQVHENLLWLSQSLLKLPGACEVLSRLYAPPPLPSLKQTLWGYPFQNPLGLAAGFDKNLRLIPLIRALGFGFMEAGSISALPAPGNPKPRLFRLPQDEAILNRMGLNNEGIAVLSARIETLPQDWPVGISIVKTPLPTILGDKALADFAETLRGVHGHGAYVTLNISCPNTGDGKTFEDPEALDLLLKTLRAREREIQAMSGKAPRPWCIKVSPDIPPQQLAELFDIGVRYGIAGWIATNTTQQRERLMTSGSALTRYGAGGLSGKPLHARSTEVLAQLAQLAIRCVAPPVLIGVGGIHDVDSAWEKIIHGASLLQVYTGLVYEGPGLIRTLCAGLDHKLREHGFSHLQEAVGSALR